MQQVIPMPISLKARLELSSQRLPVLKRTQDFNLSSNDSNRKIPEYNSLFDTNLQRYFRNNRVQKVLVRNGVIDPEGHVMPKKWDIPRRSTGRLPSVGLSYVNVASPESKIKTMRDPYLCSQESQITEKGYAHTQMSVRETSSHPTTATNNTRATQKLAKVVPREEKPTKIMPRQGRNHSVGLIQMKPSSRSPTPDKVYLQHRKEKDWKSRETRLIKGRGTQTLTSSSQNLRPITSQELKGILERYKNKVQESVGNIVLVDKNEQSTIVENNTERTLENESRQEKTRVLENENENEKEVEKEDENVIKIEQSEVKETEKDQEQEPEKEEQKKETEQEQEQLEEEVEKRTE